MASPAPVAARDSIPLRLATFAALALFGALHWITLVVEPPGGKTLLAVVVATAGGAALAVLPRLRLPGAATAAVAALLALATLVLALLVMGLPARLLLPSHFGELFDGLDRGLVGVSHVDWPYDGPDPWVRLTLLLGAPALVVPAAALAFWPAREGAGVRRALALVLLLVLYGVAATEREIGEPLAKGLLLLLFVAAWLWLPRLRLRELAPAATVVAAVGLLALPLAARLDADQPWWDYTTWNPFGGGKDITFDWNHSYGPLDWPREGTTLLNIRSRRAHYWKTETLDRFDGFRWLHSEDNDRGTPLAELPSRPPRPGRRWDYFQFNPRWNARFQVTVRSLRSDFVVGAGTTYDVTGAGATASASDGTTVKLSQPLEEGDTYTVRAYVPDPTATQMRGAPDAYPDALAQYTAIFLPRRGETAGGSAVRSDASRSAEAPPQPQFVPFRGTTSTHGDAVRRRILASPYAGMYRLTRRLTEGAATQYDAVQRIERHLKTSYTYDEDVPRHPYPLTAFLFRDHRGYCQQFSGAMALMLRMAGIPARVSAGFGQGSRNVDSGEYRVRDLDAHSWVEAYFPGIGWVTFDPTPAAAPAQRSLSTNSPGSNAGSIGSITRRNQQNQDRPAGSVGGRAKADDGGLGPWPVVGGVLAALAAAAAGLVALRRRRLRNAPLGSVADAQLREVERALGRLGWRVPGGATLLALERRLSRAAGPAAASYLARLRLHRYAVSADGLPGPSDRRAFRRALTAGRGLRARARGMLSIPPGGPRIG